MVDGSRYLRTVDRATSSRDTLVLHVTGWQVAEVPYAVVAVDDDEGRIYVHRDRVPRPIGRLIADHESAGRRYAVTIDGKVVLNTF
jgi:hypothetical protein